MNLLKNHSAWKDISGKNFTHAVGKDRVVVLLSLQLALQAGCKIQQANGHRIASLVGHRIIFAAANLEDVQKCVFSLMGNTNQEVKIIAFMLGVIKNQNVFALFVKKTAGGKCIIVEGNRNTVFIRFVLQ